MASRSALTVAGMTAAALATIGFFGYQAAEHRPESLHAARPAVTPRPSPSPPTAAAAPQHLAPEQRFTLPDHSGRGRRVVYSVSEDRVWLVAEGDAVRHTFKVVPGGVDPVPGAYTVTSRSGRVTGSDGVPVEHVVRFAKNHGVVIGFSAAVGPTPDGRRATGTTGGVRESQADGVAMWRFATVGVKVVVVP